MFFGRNCESQTKLLYVWLVVSEHSCIVKENIKSNVVCTAAQRISFQRLDAWLKS